MIVEFDYDTRTVVRAQDQSGEWWELHGKCLRCGKCCKEGAHCGGSFKWENVDDQRIAVCTAQWSKPWQCMLSPCDPGEKLEDGCGYRWQKCTEDTPESG